MPKHIDKEKRKKKKSFLSAAKFNKSLKETGKVIRAGRRAENKKKK